MQELIKKVTEELGFCPMVGKGYDGTLSNRVPAIKPTIGKHNSIMTQLGQDYGFEVAEYLMAEPVIDEIELKDLMGTLFKDF